MFPYNNILCSLSIFPWWLIWTHTRIDLYTRVKFLQICCIVVTSMLHNCISFGLCAPVMVLFFKECKNPWFGLVYQFLGLFYLIQLAWRVDLTAAIISDLVGAIINFISCKFSIISFSSQEWWTVGGDRTIHVRINSIIIIIINLI